MNSLGAGANNADPIPVKNLSSHPQMNEIKISEKGVNKLLHNINSNKATGPDELYGKVICGLLYRELEKGPQPETTLLTRLVQQNVLAVDVRDCLKLMEKNEMICKTFQCASGETVWQLSTFIVPDQQTGDFAAPLGSIMSGQSVTKNERDTEHVEPESLRPTSICSIETMNVLTEVSKSVGYITGKKESGTCWRVGYDKIITAAHVVKDNIWNTVLDILYEDDLKLVKVDFVFISKKSSSVFEVEPKVLFIDEHLDVAVLQLKPDDEKQFPPPIETFHKLNPEKDDDKHIYLISHNKGEKKKSTLELVFGILQRKD